MDIILNTTFNNPRLPVVPLPGFYDNFQGNPSPTSLGVTSREARPWEYPQGAGWERTTRGTASGYNRQGSQLAIAEGYSSDGILRATLAALPTDDPRCGLAFRVLSNTNYLYLMANTSGNLTLYEAGTGQGQLINSGTPFTAAGDVLEVQFIGQAITARLNGVVILEATSSAHETATKHGLFNWNSSTGSSSNAEWDDIEFIPA